MQKESERNEAAEFNGRKSIINERYIFKRVNK